MSIPSWCMDTEEVLHFAYVLNELGEFGEPADVIYYFEKPYKWDPEHVRYEELGRPEDVSKVTREMLDES